MTMVVPWMMKSGHLPPIHKSPLPVKSSGNLSLKESKNSDSVSVILGQRALRSLVAFSSTYIGFLRMSFIRLRAALAMFEIPSGLLGRLGFEFACMAIALFFMGLFSPRLLWETEIKRLFLPGSQANVSPQPQAHKRISFGFQRGFFSPILLWRIFSITSSRKTTDGFLRVLQVGAYRLELEGRTVKVSPQPHLHFRGSLGSL